MNREGKKCILYPRVSTEMQVEGYSLDGQKNSLKRFAEREEMQIVGIYEDAGKSGKSIEGRPAFKRMLSDIQEGLDVDYVLVYKLSRFGRNAADILNSLEFIQSYQKNFLVKNVDFLALTFNDNAVYFGNGSGETEGNTLKSVDLSFFDHNGAYISFNYKSDLITAQLSYSVLAEKGKAISIQTHYVHDPNLLFSNVSVSISAGLGISVSGGNCDVFSAEPMTFIAIP